MHLGIIPDGNRRWAKKRGLTANHGHQEGCHALNRLLNYFIDHSTIDTLTIYAFSLENTQRSKLEICGISQLFNDFMTKNLPKFIDHHVCVRVVGDRGLMAKKDIETCHQLESATSLKSYSGKALKTLNVCYYYSGQWHLKNTFHQSQSSQHTFEHLMDQSIAPIDLLIRTGKEFRISNFCLWQLAYAELLFLDIFWPEITVNHITEALSWYQSRQRRYGGGV